MNMYENAIDSIAHAIQHYSDLTAPVERRFKYTFLHLSQSVLLILKVRLSYREKLLIKKVDKGRVTEQTSDFGELKSKLKSLEKSVQINNYDLTTAIDRLADKRNDIEHYEFVIDRHESDVLVAEIFQFLQHFFHNELFRNVSNIADEVDRVESGLWQNLITTDGYLPEAKKAALRWIKNKNLPSYHCSYCKSKTASIDREHSISIAHPYLKQVQGTSVRCFACYSYVGFLTACPNKRCGNPVYVECNGPRIAYCPNCEAEIKAKYPDISQPILAAEVKRSCNLIRFRPTNIPTLQSYLGIDESWSYLVELIEKGYVTLTPKRVQDHFMSVVKKGQKLYSDKLITSSIKWIKD